MSAGQQGWLDMLGVASRTSRLGYDGDPSWRRHVARQRTSNDLIGFQVHADLIRAVVTNAKMLPTIIGVFGDWAVARPAS